MEAKKQARATKDKQEDPEDSRQVLAASTVTRTWQPRRFRAESVGSAPGGAPSVTSGVFERDMSCNVNSLKGVL